ncbi:MAG: ScpA family protein [Pseudomonadota bacterium]
MSDPFEDPPRAPAEPETLHVDVEGFEGPLDLLLDLAKREKVDITKIKILPLAEQYLAFVEEARSARIELKADFLVMAAWLVFLKSRLLAPKDTAEAQEGAEMAGALAFRLKRLQAMREAAAALQARPQLGRDVFERGIAGEVRVTTAVTFRASLYDLLAAYGRARQDEIVRTMTMEKRAVFSLVDARRVLERLVGRHGAWLPLEDIVAAMPAGEPRRAATASSFGAILEMVREGAIEVNQAGAFAPLYVKARGDG